MKLLKSESCQWESDGGNVKTLTALGDAWMATPSDRGSIPLASTIFERFIDTIDRSLEKSGLLCFFDANISHI
ncbi:MAG: hypothetical protein JG776_698 [Caloramator sp.]|nr:hypothetical protein [Caloramator sp.]